MANEMHEQALQDKVGNLVTGRFGGDYRAAFAHYDGNRDGMISKDELKNFFGDAGIGSSWSRWAWAEKLIDTLDADGDGSISWPEFAALFGMGENAESGEGGVAPAT